VPPSDSRRSITAGMGDVLTRPESRAPMPCTSAGAAVMTVPAFRDEART
jgi:hypothetical protein